MTLLEGGGAAGAGDMRAASYHNTYSLQQYSGRMTINVNTDSIVCQKVAQCQSKASLTSTLNSKKCGRSFGEGEAMRREGGGGGGGGVGASFSSMSLAGS